MTDRPALIGDEVEITAGMIEAGCNVIVSEPDVAPLGFFFSPRGLAGKVYAAMEICRLKEQG